MKWRALGIYAALAWSPALARATENCTELLAGGPQSTLTLAATIPTLPASPLPAPAVTTLRIDNHGVLWRDQGQGEAPWINLNSGWLSFFRRRLHIQALAVSGDQKRLFIYASDKSGAKPEFSTWDAQSGKRLRRYRGGRLAATPASTRDIGQKRIKSSAFSPDGKFWLLNDGKRIVFLNLETGVAMGTYHLGDLSAHELMRASVMAFSPDSKLVLATDTVSDNAIGTQHAAQLLSTSTGLAVGAPLLLRHSMRSAEFSRSGEELLITHVTGEAELWNVRALRAHIYLAAGKPFRMPDGSAILTARFAADGENIELESGNGAQAQIPIARAAPAFAFDLGIAETITNEFPVKIKITYKEPINDARAATHDRFANFPPPLYLFRIVESTADGEIAEVNARGFFQLIGQRARDLVKVERLDAQTAPSPSTGL